MSTVNKNIITRRNFLKLSVYGAGSLAVGIYGINSSGKVNYSDPAYLYWNKNTQGALNLEKYLVLCASLAASAHNTQPWKFSIKEKKIDVFADLNRNLGQADKHRRMMLLSVGCAIENIKITANHLGMNTSIRTKSDSEFSTTGLCAQINLKPNISPKKHVHFDTIFKRQTTRSIYADEIVNEQLKTSLATMNDFPFLSLHWFDQTNHRKTMVSLHKAAVRDYVNDDSAYLDSLKWWRYSEKRY